VLMTSNEIVVRILVHLGLFELHAVAFGVALDLSVPEHWQAGQGGEQGADSEVLVSGAKLIDRGAFIRIAHETDVALENVGVELDSFLEIRTILRVLFVAQHVHESTVVDAMHAKSADEVAFEEPEGFGKEEGSRNLGGDAVDDLAPELVRHQRVEVLLRHRVFGS